MRKKIINPLFISLLVTYIALLIVDHVKSGLISDHLNLNYLLILVILAAIFGGFLFDEKEEKKKTKKKVEVIIKKKNEDEYKGYKKVDVEVIDDTRK